MQKLNFEAIGTPWSIETPHKLSETLQQAIHDRINEFDHTYSRFRSDSLVSQLRTLGTYTFPEDAAPLLEFYRDLYDTTEGSVTPLIGETLERIGYDASYSLKGKPKPPIPLKWDRAMTWTGTKVVVHTPIVLDMGAAGKGYLIDIVAELLEQEGIKNYTIDASGDIRHRGKTGQRVGLENPHDTLSVIGVAELNNASLCASASNRRKWGDWHHIIDAHTGKPVSHVVATWVIADSTMIADGLATALFFVPPGLLKKWKFQSIRLFGDGRIEKTENFVGELYT